MKRTSLTLILFGRRRCRTILLLLLALPWAGPLDAQAPSTPTTAFQEAFESRHVVVGYDRDLSPYSFVDDEGRPAGFTVELLKEIAALHNLSLEWRPMSHPQLLAALESGEIDLIPNLAATPDLEDRFVVNLAHSSDWDVLVRTKASEVRSERDVTGRRILVRRDDPAQAYLEERGGVGEILLADTFAEVLRRLADGEADAALVPPGPARHLARRLELDNLRFEQPLRGAWRTLHFTVGPDSAALAAELETALNIATRTAVYKEIYDRWLQDPVDLLVDRVLWWVVVPLTGLVALFALTSLWLRRMVARRTRELEREMAERRRLEAKMAQSQKLESLGVLAGGIAHDFNNLLMGVMGNAGLARLDLEEGSSARERLGDIEDAANQAAKLCRQMLAYSGKGAFVFERIDLSRLVTDLMPVIESSVPPGARIEVRCEEHLPQLEGDPDQLRQVVLSLITNGAEALGDQGGRVQVTTGRVHYDRAALSKTYLGDDVEEGDYVFVEVVDDGAGMDATTRERMFDPFFSTKFTGRGLGLAATLGIVRGHRGTLEVESALGQGTRFRVLFPQAAVTEAAVSDARPRVTMDDPTGAAETILVIDDEEMVADVARQTLELGGYQVLVVHGGAEALEIFAERDGEVDLVLLDMTMPGMSGEETCRRLRELRSELPVIVSSGYSEQEMRLQFQTSGILSFLQKPYSPLDLLQLVHEALHLPERHTAGV